MPQGAGMIWLAEHLEGGKPGVSLDLSVLPGGTTLRFPSLINVESMLSVAFGECFLMRNPVCILCTCFQLPHRESSKLIGLANGLKMAAAFLRRPVRCEPSGVVAETEPCFLHCSPDLGVGAGAVGRQRQ